MSEEDNDLSQKSLLIEQESHDLFKTETNCDDNTHGSQNVNNIFDSVKYSTEKFTVRIVQISTIINPLLISKNRNSAAFYR